MFAINDCRFCPSWYQGWAGMTFGSSGTGTGMDNSIPKVREREGNWKNPFPQFGNGKGMKKNHSQNSGMGREWKNLFPKFGNGKGMKKSIPTIREREGNEKNPFPKFGKGIRGLHSWEWPGTGIPAHPWMGPMGKMMLTYRATNALLTNSGCGAVLTVFCLPEVGRCR